MVSSPVDSSILSRHTGQVGSSMSAGVGGATGFVFNDVEATVDNWPFGMTGSDFALEGVNGSFDMSGKEDPRLPDSSSRNSIDLTKTTWQFSGC